MTNMIGNGVATIIVARWENEFDAARAKKVLDEKHHETPAPQVPVHAPETPAEAIRDLEQSR